MIEYDLSNIDSEDLDYLLLKVEASFGIKFLDDELVDIITFGQLCDHIVGKMKIKDMSDCTSQQAFYKLREALSRTLFVEDKTILPRLRLADIFSRKSRRTDIKKLEEHLDFKLNILRPSNWLIITLTILFLSSVIGFFIVPQIGLLTILLSLLGIRLAYKFANELDVETIADLSTRMTRENYLKSRRNPSTFNKSEIEKILTEWFSNYFDIDKSKLTREASF